MYQKIAHRTRFYKPDHVDDWNAFPEPIKLPRSKRCKVCGINHLSATGLLDKGYFYFHCECKNTLTIKLAQYDDQSFDVILEKLAGGDEKG